jgi:putative inorganic carbon (HCO3(-)) transporter
MPDAGRPLARSVLWFDGPLAALALSAGVGLWVAWGPRSAQQAAWWFWAAILLGVAVSHACRTDAAWRTLAVAASLAGAALALYVVLQFPYLGYDAKIAPIHRLGVALGSLVPRVAGWAPMPNTVATALEGLVPLAVAVAIGSMRPWSLNPTRASFYEGLAAASAAVMVLAVLVVASRGAWIALGAGGLAAACAWGLGPRARARGKAVAAAATAVAVLGVATAVHLIEPSVAGVRLSSVFDRPDRLSVYANSLLLVRDFPFTGIGPGDQFAMALSRYVLLIQVPFLTYAHNLYLGIWLELGLLGMVAASILAGALLAAVVVGERTVAGAWFRGAWVGAFVILVHGMMDARQLVDRWSWLPLFLLLGLAAARLARREVRVPPAAFAVPLALAAAFLAAAWPCLVPLQAKWQANRGMLAEARAELGALDQPARDRLLADARRGFEASVAADPGQPTARRRLGLMAIDERRFEQAYDDLRASWRSEPGNPVTRKALGLACAWTGRVAAARELLAPFEAIFDELNAWSWHWEQEGRLEQAIYATRTALLLSPANREVAARLASLESRPTAPQTARR